MEEDLGRILIQALSERQQGRRAPIERELRRRRQGAGSRMAELGWPQRCVAAAQAKDGAKAPSRHAEGRHTEVTPEIRSS